MHGKQGEGKQGMSGNSFVKVFLYVVRIKKNLSTSQAGEGKNPTSVRK